MNLNLETITVGNDPVFKRGTPYSEYDKLFDPLQPGMCLRVPGENARTLAKALHHYIKRKGKTGVRASVVTNYPGAKKGQEGRVWLLPVEKKADKKLKVVG